MGTEPHSSIVPQLYIWLFFLNLLCSHNLWDYRAVGHRGCENIRAPQLYSSRALQWLFYYILFFIFYFCIMVPRFVGLYSCGNIEPTPAPCSSRITFRRTRSVVFLSVVSCTGTVLTPSPRAQKGAGGLSTQRLGGC